MRRTDRQVTNRTELEAILNNTRIIHLGLMDSEYPYVVPLHFGYEFIKDALHIYVHGHREGKKFDLVKANPNVFIEIDANEALVSGGDIPCMYSSVYGSVMGRGKATYVDDGAEKAHGLDVIMKHQTQREFTFTEPMINSVGVVHIVVTEYTGKERKQMTDDVIIKPLGMM